MHILSIDIGIKNMSHCLFRVNNGQFIVLQWGVIDLTNDSTMTCNALTKKKGVCGKRATYRKDDNHFCLTHAKSSSFILPSQDTKSLSSKKVQDIRNICNNLSVSIESGDTKQMMLKRIHAYKELTELVPIQRSNAKLCNLVDLGKSLQEKYSAIFNMVTIDTVLIENQIGPIAIRMKSLQGMVTQYWIMQGVPDIQFVSANNKLKNFLPGKSTYKERKAKGIEVARRYVTEYPDMYIWNNMFHSHTKKDDLADALLQGIWYMGQNHLCGILQ
jgi:hypothetical protein